MKIADYGKAITSYIESPTTGQKLKSKEKALLLAERDNVNTPDLEQSPDSFLRPGETLEDFDVTFRRPNSIGGRVRLSDGTKPSAEEAVTQQQIDYTKAKEKPFTLDQFKDKADIYVGALQNKSLPLADIKSALNKFTQKGIDDGMFTADEAIKVVMDLRSSYRDLAQKQRLRGVVEGIGDVERDDFQFGGGADAQRAGTVASQKYFRERKVDKPTPVFEGPAGGAKLTGVKFANKAQETEYIKILKNRFKYPKGSKEARKIATNSDLAKKFGISIDNVERVNRALINKLNLNYPAQTYEGYEKIQRDRDKLRKENIKKTSSGAVESKIKRDIKKINPTALAKDVDIAHRASLKANANLGANYLTTSLGIDAKIVNQSIIKPIEQKLGTLYENQKNLIKDLKPGKVPKDIQKQLEKINIKISELADRTDGVLQGVLVDEKTLKPKIYGIDYSKVLGFGLVDKPVSELTPDDRALIQLNISEQIKAAKKPDIKSKLLKAVGTGAKTVGKVIKPLGYAFGANAVNNAISQANDMGIELSLTDKMIAFDSGDAQVAINNWKRRNDPEFAAAERAKDLAQMTDDFEEVGQTTFGKYNDQIKNIKLP